ncbi:TetR/AcrR family transcriptional regulator [Actinomycetospora termitidis]|uniref:Helix-turn-helix domain-containing protein n=1 Tax=Actinomycetospora termitidis TaxID=3053470 RepID=A0ABT7MHU7_9PSEU|nr:TetR/AcrR family transcriptional regulator [Actinomycetospora sp. Odt1-22]MDL5160220.1 helix-turn-helix domain-containing protein [Actinomycetospora sp. Odt1-22]
MARWEPDARLRLVRAAIDLYAEQGYEVTTVAQVAERAGLTKATFFRHFPDKREVLFAGQEHHSTLLAEGAAAAPDGATPLEAVTAALDHATAAFTPEQRAWGPRLRAVVASSAELQERAAFKRAHLAAALADALRRRGVPDPTAAVAAELGVEAFHRAFDRWGDTTDDRSYGDLARSELHDLHAAATALR